MPAKKRVIVVKSLRDLSPKKQILVARKPTEEEGNYLEPSLIGNSSPSRAEKGKDGNYLSRSILGDPAVFDNLERNKKRLGTSQSPERSQTGTGVKGLRTLSRDSKRSTTSPTGRRSEGNEEDEEESVDIASKPDLFISTLKKQYFRAEEIRRKTMQEETMLLAYLPVNERFNLNKEGKVLTQWQERQKDWEKIQAGISKRITASAGHTLMMSKTDDFRIKAEEYDLIQAAIPIEEKYGENIWIKTLRGNAPRSVPIGHIFTGLFCEVDRPAAVPSIIRKPRPSYLANTAKLSKPFDETLALTTKRNALSSRMQTLRPHEVTQEDADQLIVRSSGLFQWAIESAQEYFDAQERNRASTALAEEADAAGRKKKQPLSKAAKAAADAAALGLEYDDPKQALIELAGSNEVVFRSFQGQIDFQNVTFTNKGSVAIAYVWKPVVYSEGLEWATQTGQVFGSQVSHILYDQPNPSRDAQIKNSRAAFFCLQAEGTILPGQVVTTAFSFCSKGVSGAMRQTWRLQTVPPSSFRLHVKHLGKTYTSMIMELKLHGQTISLAAEEHTGRRAAVSNFISAKVMEAVAEDEVRRCLRRVREPVRVKDVEQRQVAVFSRRNAEVLRSLSAMFQAELPLYIDPERLHRFALACVKITQYNLSVVQEVFSLRKLWASLEDAASPVDSEEGSCAIEAARSRNTDAAALAVLKSEVFPEGTIEIFDEISDELISPTWDYDVARLLAGVQEAIAATAEIDDLEKRIIKRKAELEKARAKQAARLARLAAKDPDDDEEEEDEDEEEPDAEDLPPPPKHPMTIEGEALMAECLGNFDLLATKPALASFESNSLLAAVGASIGELVDNFEAWSSEAKEAVELAKEVAAGPLPSPFTSVEGAAAWRKIVGPVVEEEKVDPKAKGGKPKPAAKAPAKGKGAPVTATPEQIDGYYLSMHKKIKEGFLNMAEVLCGRVDSELAQIATARVAEAGRGGSMLYDVATFREEDLAATDIDWRRKVAFVSFDGAPFYGSTQRSAFDAVSLAQRNALRPVLQLTQAGVGVVVLLHESRVPASSPSSSTPPIEEGFADAAAPIVQSILLAKELELRDIQSRKGRKARATTRAHVESNFNVQACKSLAELHWRLRRAASAPETLGDTRLVLVVEDLAVPGVVPPEPPLPPPTITDEEAPIDIGAEEYDAYRIRKWNAKRPHRVNTQVSADGEETVLGCFADATAALKEAVEVSVSQSQRRAAGPDADSQQGSSLTIWIDASIGNLFSVRNSALQKFASATLKEAEKFASMSRVASVETRQLLLWAAVVFAMPQAQSLLQSAADYDSCVVATAAAATEAGEDSEAAVAAIASPSPLSLHFKSLFPYCIGTPEGIALGPHLTVVLGGDVRIDKIRFLDQILDSATSIVLVGELALPFVALSGRVQLQRYTSLCDEYRTACTHVLRKARLRGVRVVLPVDLLSGDEAVGPELKQRCYDKVDPDSRDDGADYEGETKTVAIELAYASAEENGIGDFFFVGSSSAGVGGGLSGTGNKAFEKVVVDRYVYDVGEKTCDLIQQEVASADLLIVWGTVGACEVGSFQAGQRVLVTNAVLPPPPDGEGGAKAAPPSDAAPKKPAHTWVIGDSSVEWFARMVDSDGELGGDLVEAGRLSFATRLSAAPVGVLGLCQSPVLEALLRRPALSHEWTINERSPPVVEEEEDDEDEDDEN